MFGQLLERLAGLAAQAAAHALEKPVVPRLRPCHRLLVCLARRLGDASQYRLRERIDERE